VIRRSPWAALGEFVGQFRLIDAKGEIKLAGTKSRRGVRKIKVRTAGGNRRSAGVSPPAGAGWASCPREVPLAMPGARRSRDGSTALTAPSLSKGSRRDVRATRFEDCLPGLRHRRPMQLRCNSRRPRLIPSCGADLWKMIVWVGKGISIPLF
jgi:hypothetical protein